MSTPSRNTAHCRGDDPISTVVVPQILTDSLQDVPPND